MWLSWLRTEGRIATAVSCPVSEHPMPRPRLPVTSVTVKESRPLVTCHMPSAAQRDVTLNLILTTSLCTSREWEVYFTDKETDVEMISFS